MRHGGFNIGGGPNNTLSLFELLDLIEAETGSRAEIRFEDWRPGDQKVYISDIRRPNAIWGGRPPFRLKKVWPT